MRVLLDTNVIIHRENKRASNYSIGNLYKWIDNLHYEKVIHPFTIDEIRKFEDDEYQKALTVKFDAYNLLKNPATPTKDFLTKYGNPKIDSNDYIDACLLYELFIGHVDIFITDDRKILRKSKEFSINESVFTVDSFIAEAATNHPELVSYKALSVKKTTFGALDLSSSFFDSFRCSYKGFDKWFLSKCDKEAYVCQSDLGDILGFLFLKLEDESENYSDISPCFRPKRRMKIGTFKVESTGFRLGERFIKIIFDNAINMKVDEVYVTLFNNLPELQALYDLLLSWGFEKYGVKNSSSGIEHVLIKKINTYNSNVSVKQNFPSISLNSNKYILPILPQYHTSLLPDSQLTTEKEDFMTGVAHRYALEKVYISWADTFGIKPGDILIFYRIGANNSNKKYTSVLTSIGIVQKIESSFTDESSFFRTCQNRSVFSDEELHRFWMNNGQKNKVIRFIFCKELKKRLTLEYLWNNNIIEAPSGPRPFTRISDDQFVKIIKDSETDLWTTIGEKNESCIDGNKT